jgi:hypothetical protein
MRKDITDIDRFADRFCLDMIVNAVRRFVADNYDKSDIRSHTVQSPESASVDDCRIEFATSIKSYDYFLADTLNVGQAEQKWADVPSGTPQLKFTPICHNL